MDFETVKGDKEKKKKTQRGKEAQKVFRRIEREAGTRTLRQTV